jgi:ribosomal-protein-alanine acetyltransferase
MSSGGGVIIRPMRKTDVARAVEIAGRLPHAPHWPPEAYRTALDATASLRRIALVAERPPSPAAEPGAALALVGFAVASVIAPQAEIETIAVAAEEQRRGTGGQLLRALLGELRTAGVKEILLEARASNQAALRLYAAVGFRQTGVRPRYYADPQEDAVLMALQDL